MVNAGFLVHEMSYTRAAAPQGKMAVYCNRTQKELSNKEKASQWP